MATPYDLEQVDPLTFTGVSSMALPIFRALSAAALLALAAGPLHAQAAPRSSGSTATASSTAWPALPAGTYELLIQLPERPLEATVVVRDSSGASAATFQPEGDPPMPVKIAVKGTELTLNGEAPKGPFEIVLERQGDVITGRWTYGGEKGRLTGKPATDIRQ